MRKTTTTIASGVLVCLVSLPSWGLGFGRLVNATTLGQPLDITIELASDPTEFLSSECVSADVLAGESAVAPQSVRTRLTTSPGSGARAIHVTTLDVIQEPVVTLTVAAGCPTRVSRQFVVFVDPPIVPLEASSSTSAADGRTSATTDVRAVPPSSTDAGSSAAVGAEPPAGQGRSEASAPAASAPAPASAPPRAVSTPKPRRDMSGAVAATGEATTKPVPSVRRPVPREADKPVRERKAPRLELERAPAVTATGSPAAANAASAAALLAAQAAAASAAEESKLAADAQRESIVALQQRLEKLQAESDATNKGIAQLQARLKQAEADRELGPLEYGLLFGGGALLLLLGLFLGRRTAGAAGTPWWSAGGSAAASSEAASGADALVDEKAGASDSAAARSSSAGGATRGAEPDTVVSVAAVPGIGGQAVDVVPVVLEEHTAPARFDRTAVEPAALVDNVPAEDGAAALLTADQLIDLEQQADFFIVLGQDDSAIDLLNARLRTVVGQSPLPLLKLLQIHRRRGERDAFDRVRDRFVRRFGEGAPVWEDGATAGPTLESHDDVVSRIAAVWSNPDDALLLIESFLVHRERPAAPLRLGALGDLQFLYLLARSLRDEGGTPDASVDLLLPIGSRTETTVVLASPLKPQSTTDSANERIDVELDFDAPSSPKSSS